MIGLRNSFSNVFLNITCINFSFLLSDKVCHKYTCIPDSNGPMSPHMKCGHILDR